MVCYLFFFAWRERMIMPSVRLLWRVRAPLVGLPHGVTKGARTRNNKQTDKMIIR